jgi:hypothetical protein
VTLTLTVLCTISCTFTSLRLRMLQKYDAEIQKIRFFLSDSFID